MGVVYTRWQTSALDIGENRNRISVIRSIFYSNPLRQNKRGAYSLKNKKKTMQFQPTGSGLCVKSIIQTPTSVNTKIQWRMGWPHFNDLVGNWPAKRNHSNITRYYSIGNRSSTWIHTNVREIFSLCIFTLSNDSYGHEEEEEKAPKCLYNKCICT